MHPAAAAAAAAVYIHVYFLALAGYDFPERLGSSHLDLACMLSTNSYLPHLLAPLYPHLSVQLCCALFSHLLYAPPDFHPTPSLVHRVCKIKSVDGSNITTYCVHECEAANRIGMRSRRFIFTGHTNGAIQVRSPRIECSDFHY